MKIVGLEVLLEGYHLTLGARQERLGVVPILIDGRDYEYLRLRIICKPPTGGNLELFVDLNDLRRLP